MFTHPFSYVMVATFLAAVGTMLAGVMGMGRSAHIASASTRLMFWRIALSFLLLVEIIGYVILVKGA